MSVFVDTSALLAVLDADDQFHQRARTIWADLLEQPEELISTSYVLVETFALVQRRLGIKAVRTLEEDILPVIQIHWQIHWISETDHRAGVAALLATGRRRLSLVDCVSFSTMRQLDLQITFAFDQHFVEQGFEVLS